MPRIDAVVNCPLLDSFRVRQVAGMFDLSLADTFGETYSAEVPSLEEDWDIGVIVGPSGSGKTSIARRAFGDAFYEVGEWPNDRAVVDGFGERSIKDITSTLTVVGFSSPPGWVKPYQVLSNGERFRCDLAKALLSDTRLVVFDEFTSVVDRTVACVGSAAVAKAVRSGRVKKRFVAVSCHYDIIEWLQPDWVLDMATRSLQRGCLHCRPNITIEIFRCRTSAWKLFARHHYLSSVLPSSATCFLGTWDDTPVAFVAVLPLVGHKKRDRISRVVTLPDFQGIGIGGGVLNAVASLRVQSGRRVNITTSHPGMMSHLKRSPLWRCVAVRKWGFRRHGLMKSSTTSWGRSVVSFEFSPSLRTTKASPSPGMGPRV